LALHLEAHAPVTPLNIPGISNGYHVDELVWRGAQLDDSAWPLLVAAGCKAVLDLNSSGDGFAAQEGLVAATDMLYRSSIALFCAFFAALYDLRGPTYPEQRSGCRIRLVAIRAKQLTLRVWCILLSRSFGCKHGVPKTCFLKNSPTPTLPLAAMKVAWGPPRQWSPMKLPGW
jgi:hypothetical protein